MEKLDYGLLEQLCAIHGPSGEEYDVKSFIMTHIYKNQQYFHTKPIIVDSIQDNLILIFGKPRTAIFAHLDSIGFTVRYQNQLVPIGSPDAETGYRVTGRDSLGPIDCELEVDEKNRVFYKFGRGIETGTSLVFKNNFRETKTTIQSPYMDNRLGVFNALKVVETLKDGIIVFTTYEEHGGGAVPLLLNHIMERYPIKNALISDITWVTDGVFPGKGVVVSLRDRNIPRKSFTDKIRLLAAESGVDFQIEVEGSGSSDGREVQLSPYPIDWCFIGAPEENVHSPDEKVVKTDIESMIELYRFLMKKIMIPLHFQNF